MLRSIASITAGFLTWSSLFLATTTLVERLGPGGAGTAAAAPGPGLLGLVLALSIAFSVVAGWVTFKVDRVRALGSSLILGVLLLAVGIVVQRQSWDAMPLWYHLAFLGALVPAVLLGYRLAVTRS
ncbi:MAG: hypothetical protein JNL44_10425 [Gemmatimonadetes bacterium]|nr:hypothetical protein [Gemmatimonadota bacterium]